MKTILIAVAALTIPASASAAVTLVTTQTNDTAFEGAGGFLQTYYGLPLVGNSALPPIERAVGQVKSGSNKRRGLYTPTAATGIPTPVGTGVTQALTNVGAFSGGADTNFVSGTPVNFTFSRVGNKVTYTVGADTWNDTKTYYADINGLEFRIRSNTTSAVTPADSHSISNLVFNDAATVNQSLTTLSAADGAVLINLYSGVVGDFTLTGKYTFTWTGVQPTGSRLASQIKLLDLPVLPGGVPEPESWALLVAGFGITGAAMRRRKTRVVAA